ncbi:MAG: hypothetical protein Q4C25_02845 [Bacillota bacterium]|nr:hypothetical protein [Bacillota bacterium]
MNTEQTAGKGKSSALVKVLYVAAIVMAVIFVYTLIDNILYFRDYITSYGMTFGDMWRDGVRYILSGSFGYIAYALILLAAGSILKMLQGDRPAKVTAEGAEEPQLAKAEEPAEVKEDVKAEAAEIAEKIVAGAEAASEEETEEKSDSDKEDK